MKRIFTGQQKTTKATAQYRKHIPSAVDIPYREPRITEPASRHKKMASVKCIIYSADGQQLITYGMCKRAIEYNAQTDELHVYLYNDAGNSIEVIPYAPPTDTIAGMTIPEIRRYGVEFYHA